MKWDLNWFQLGPIPSDTMGGYYNYKLVILSYVIAIMASYVALDFAGRLRATPNRNAKLYWLVGGAFAMGAGIWSMHFIGMLAFIMAMTMIYDPFWTIFSMVAAILASGLAMYLLRTEERPLVFMALGGIFLGLGICTMHYMGMTGMQGVQIRYMPSLFFLSIAIAITASWAALWLALQSNKGTLGRQFRLKLMSALVMGAAICGMHYTGMAAAVFYAHPGHVSGIDIEPFTLALSVAAVTAGIIGLALIVSTYQQLVDVAIQKEKQHNVEQQLVIARQAGMAEVADSVLHNVGNVLNSVNISAAMVAEKILNSELDGLVSMRDLLKQHQNDFGSFVTNDPKGHHLFDYLVLLGSFWQEEKNILSKELASLNNNIQHIKDVISMHQALSKVVGTEEFVSVEDVLEDTIQISVTNFERYGISAERQYEKLEQVFVDKSKLMQILINLIRNAKDSLTESANSDKKLTFVIRADANDMFIIQVIDNGVGIPPENLVRIFSHGFTTKAKGHGFGLHTSSIVAREMGGELIGDSKGEGQGATFTLRLPYKIRKGNSVVKKGRSLKKSA